MSCGRGIGTGLLARGAGIVCPGWTAAERARLAAPWLVRVNQAGFHLAVFHALSAMCFKLCLAVSVDVLLGKVVGSGAGCEQGVSMDGVMAVQSSRYS